MKLDRERLADHLQDAWNGCHSLPPIDIYGDEGQILINAILADIAAQGFAIVPVEPTEAMLNHPEVDVGEKTMRKAWRAMLAAKPGDA